MAGLRSHDHTVPYGPPYGSVWSCPTRRQARAAGSPREDWAAAALAAIADGGLAAVAVEPLAARLGTTKGSFYWHFANRDALLAAALALWEETTTTDVARPGRGPRRPDPAVRLPHC